MLVLVRLLHVQLQRWDCSRSLLPIVEELEATDEN